MHNSERQPAVERLGDSQAHLAGIVNTAMDAIISVDSQHRIVLFNAAAERMFRCSAATAIGQPLDRFIPPRFVEQHRQHIKNFSDTGITSRSMGLLSEVVGLRADGEEFPLEATISQIELAGQKLFTVILRDLTERKQAEQALQESERRFRELSESLPQLIWTCRADGMCDYLSPQWVKYTGIAEAEQLGLGWLQQLHPDDRERTITTWNATASVGAFFDIEFRIRRQDGVYRWFKTRAVPLRDGQGQIVKWFGTNTDIEEQKQSEIAITEWKNRYEATINASGQILYDWNPATNEVTYGGNFRRTLGYSAEEMAGGLAHWLELIHPEDVAAFNQEIERVIETGESSHLEYRVRRKDGAYIFVEDHGYFFFDAQGAMARMVGFVRDITERRRSETALHESAERLRLAVQAANVGLWDWDIRTNQVVYSREWKSQLGYEDHEIGNEFSEWERRVHPDDLASALERVQQSLVRQEEAHEVEFRMRHKDGSWRWIYTRGEVLRDTDGTPVRMLGCHVDITERKQAEAALKHSEERFRALTENATDLIGVLDANAIVRYISPSLYPILGYRVEEWLGKSAIEFVHPDDAQSAAEALQKSLQNHDTGGPSEFRMRHQNGSWRILEARDTNLLENKAVAGIVINARDITERKQAEEALRKAEEKYRSIFENAVEGIFQSTPDGSFIAVNPALARILGYASTEELIASRTDIEAQHYVDANCRRELQRRLAEKGVVQGFECEIFRKDLSKIWAVENIRAICDESGAVAYYEGSIEDITERKHLEDQLRQAQKMEAIGQLAGGIAHDFNNLLTAINGYSELTMRQLQSEDPLHHHVGEIKKAGERAAALTRQLLAFSRKQVLQPKILDLNSLVSELEKMLRRLIGENIDLQTLLDPELGSIKADPGQIEQVIMNLAVNARDAMVKGGKLTIETANVYLDEDFAEQHIAITPGAYVMLAINDTGSGMDEQTQARIFEPFFTTKEVGKGTGLGLSTVYGIVRQSGGNIWVYSEVGRGTTFKVYLPRIDEGAQADSRTPVAQDALQGTETVLLTEDEEGVRKLSKRVLEMYGYQVLEAANGEAALLLCESYDQPIDLLLSDVIMPGMNGCDLADHLSRLRPTMKLLLMSGYTNNAIIPQKVLDEGINFIQKPFTPNALAAKVREVLDKQ